jgi:hypothetical protein
LSRGRHLLFDGKVCRKWLGLRVTHILSVTFIMNEDISPTPLTVTLAGAAGIVVELYCTPGLVKELLGLIFRVRGIHGDS